MLRDGRIMELKTTYLTLMLAAALTAGVSGCAGTSKTASGAGIGALTGAGAGALIGHLAGGGNATWIGAAAGAVGGGLIGAGIGHYLDEQDQKTAANAEVRVLSQPLKPGQEATTTWKSDHNQNVEGTVIVRNVGQASGGKECRTTTHTVYSGGQEHRETATTCKDPGTGAWTREA
jgi:surface antigen